MADFLMQLFQLKKVNEIYDNALPNAGIDFLNAVLTQMKIKCHVTDTERQNIPKTGAFISVSNHPFGLLDGIFLIKVMAEVRPDYKVVANFLLKKIAPLEDYFISVNPFEVSKQDTANFAGLKAALKHVAAGHPLGLFPAGEVSTYQPDTKTISDRVWTLPAIKLLQKAHVPVLPVYFQGTNSILFHLLGIIHPVLRTASIPAEFVKKQNQTIHLRIGKPILPEELTEFETTEKLGRYLRAKVYALGSALEVKKFFIPSLRALKKPQKIIDPIPVATIEEEIGRLPQEHKVHSKGNFEVYIAKAIQIPNILNELGRLREITFREVGEGSNRKVDLDEFDLYYDHLFVWDKQAGKIIGAYRLGKGDQIIEKYDKNGFYIHSLFHLSDELKPILRQAVELGRSFVVKEYQQRPLPLFLLWQGILHFLVHRKQYKYLIGPVSISNKYSPLSKQILITFIQKHYYDHKLAALVKPRNQYKVKVKNIDPEILLEKSESDINKIDKFISEIEPEHFRVPVLLKKYIMQNARIIGFNIDPKFNDALDGLMILNLEDAPKSTIDNLSKEMEIK
jgi:putative hemolysin